MARSPDRGCSCTVATRPAAFPLGPWLIVLAAMAVALLRRRLRLRTAARAVAASTQLVLGGQHLLAGPYDGAREPPAQPWMVIEGTSFPCPFGHGRGYDQGVDVMRGCIHFEQTFDSADGGL